MDTFFEKIFGEHWKTYLFGYLGAFGYYMHSLGPNLPHDFSGWMNVLVAVAIGGVGKVAADHKEK